MAGCALMPAAATVLGGTVQAQADPVVAQGTNISLAVPGPTVPVGGTVAFTVSITNDTGAATCNALTGLIITCRPRPADRAPARSGSAPKRPATPPSPIR
ncbi:hypothetical protein OG401_40135 [Kitasatospora purpeofusca]|uniref:hypothetical protein n=1 Tax=Kitasatospora purpeofusca TaxID=67352 RepID=UPI00225515F9|nr:hypothetical protein [Kitasatospora purpeofusca]MCX4690434.1 hypothetical protein [Kitasatospora purpeofusca]